MDTEPSNGLVAGEVRLLVRDVTRSGKQPAMSFLWDVIAPLLGRGEAGGRDYLLIVGDATTGAECASRRFRHRRDAERARARLADLARQEGSRTIDWQVAIDADQ